MYYVYVLHSLKDRNLYIGSTGNIERRKQDHDYGEVASTATRRPLKMIYYEAHLSKKDALRREKYFKTTKGKSTIKQMLRETLSSL